jgi:hypothetical protein
MNKVINKGTGADVVNRRNPPEGFLAVEHPAAVINVFQGDLQEENA